MIPAADMGSAAEWASLSISYGIATAVTGVSRWLLDDSRTDIEVGPSEVVGRINVLSIVNELNPGATHRVLRMLVQVTLLSRSEPTGPANRSMIVGSNVHVLVDGQTFPWYRYDSNGERTSTKVGVINTVVTELVKLPPEPPRFTGATSVTLTATAYT
jgi:hypothetical protein